LHGSHVAWQEQKIPFPMGKEVLSYAKKIIVPAMQHGCRAKPLYDDFHVRYKCLYISASRRLQNSNVKNTSGQVLGIL